MEMMIRMQSYVTHWLIASRQYINYSKNLKGHPMNMVKAGNVTERGDCHLFSKDYFSLMVFSAK